VKTNIDLEPKKLFAYYRVSTDDQNLGSQEHACRNWIESLPDCEIVEEFSDFAESGANNEREALKHMLNRLNEVDGIVVFDETRLARDFEKGMMILFQFERMQKRIYIASNHEILNSLSDSEVLVYTIKQWASAMERKKINERIRAGLAKARANGVKLGRPRAKINWKYYDELLLQLKNNKSACARVMKIAPQTLFRKLKERKEKEMSK
jgi:DNA invertase Pin-like site-specific DNA recombinase